MTATQAQARALGFTTPQGWDSVQDGDNAITTNAQVAADNILQLRAAVGGDPLPVTPPPTALTWTNVPLLPGFAYRPGYPLQVAIDAAGMVYLRGHMNPDGFGGTDNPVAFATLPAWAIPTSEVRWIGWQSGAASATFGGFISGDDGTMRLQVDAASRVPRPTALFCVIAQAWQSKNGGAGNPSHLRGTGSPVGVITPSAPGIHYTDTAGTLGAWEWISTGTTNTSWIVLYGDTGVRKITPTNGTAPVFTLRRAGSLVTLGMYQWQHTAAAAILDPIPAGFYPAGSTRFPVGKTSGAASEVSIYYVTGTQYHMDPVNYVAGTQLSTSTTWTTGAPWPVVLPGTPG